MYILIHTHIYIYIVYIYMHTSFNSCIHEPISIHIFGSQTAPRTWFWEANECGPKRSFNLQTPVARMMSSRVEWIIYILYIFIYRYIRYTYIYIYRSSVLQTSPLLLFKYFFFCFHVATFIASFVAWKKLFCIPPFASCRPFAVVGQERGGGRNIKKCNAGRCVRVRCVLMFCPRYFNVCRFLSSVRGFRLHLLRKVVWVTKNSGTPVHTYMLNQPS